MPTWMGRRRRGITIIFASPDRAGCQVVFPQGGPFLFRDDKGRAERFPLFASRRIYPKKPVRPGSPARTMQSTYFLGGAIMSLAALATRNFTTVLALILMA